jgi:hypothetical protein
MVMIECLKHQIDQCHQVLNDLSARLDKLKSPAGLAPPKASALLGQFQFEIAKTLAKTTMWDINYQPQTN